MRGKPREEWRLVCANYGTTGHSSHSRTKKDRAKAFKDKAEADRHSALHDGKFYGNEAPYRVQRREVTPWQDVTP